MSKRINPPPPTDLNKVKTIIETLKTIDIEKEQIENIELYIREIMDGYGVNGMNFYPGLLLYRGINYKEKPRFYGDIIYPPLHIAQKMNRANITGEQMFYATSSKRAVFYELKVKPGDTLIITEWITNNELSFNSVGYTKTNFELLGSSRPMPIISVTDRGTINEFIADYLSATFCQDISEKNDHLYKLTSAIAKVHLANAYDSMFSGLFYPTFRFQANEDNYAVRKNTIDKGLLDFSRIEFIEILDIQEKRYKYRILDQAEEILNGTIKWKNLNRQWTTYDDADELFFVIENNNVVTYNERGDQINSD